MRRPGAPCPGAFRLGVPDEDAGRMVRVRLAEGHLQAVCLRVPGEDATKFDNMISDAFL